jgi:uncharacterized membrane protein
MNYLLRGVPGHPLHPPLTDATIGAYTFATIAGVLSALGIAEDGFAQAWWLALVVGLVTTPFTVTAGLADYVTISRGTPLKRTATTHALLNATASVFFVLAAIFGHAGYEDQAVTAGPLILTLIGFGLLTAGGTVGGSITYVHGMRVLDLVDEPTRRAVVPAPHPEKEAAEGR